MSEQTSNMGIYAVLLIVCHTWVCSVVGLCLCVNMEMCKERWNKIKRVLVSCIGLCWVLKLFFQHLFTELVYLVRICSLFIGMLWSSHTKVHMYIIVSKMTLHQNTLLQISEHIQGAVIIGAQVEAMFFNVFYVTKSF